MLLQRLLLPLFPLDATLLELFLRLTQLALAHIRLLRVLLQRTTPHGLELARRALRLLVGRDQLRLECLHGAREVLVLRGQLLHELLLSVEFFLRKRVSSCAGGMRGGGRTASCLSLFPSVVRMVVSFARRLRYCAASVSFSSLVRSSSRCSRWIGSKSSLSAWPLTAPADQPSFEDDRDVPTVDEHLQKIGADAFNRFQRRITNMDRESVGILSSSFHLRERLAQVLFLFRENAAELFPRKVSHQPREIPVDPNSRQQWRKSKRYKAPPHVASPTLVETLDPEDLPYQLEMFARDVTTFLDCLNEFPEFTDEAVNASIRSLEGDLKYWASCLKAYEGVPTIRFAQKHASQNLLNLSTVATFFSAVTATTMQFSYNMTGGGTAAAVNSFWFTSLVFSIGAAVNSLLGLTWKQAMYRSPGHRVPWWVLIWIKRSPLVFLVLSVACFSMGLVLFAYASGQDRITCTLTTVFSAFSCFGLAAVSTWFASERWIFLRHKGQKWLADAISETKVRVSAVRGISWLLYEPRALCWAVSRWAKRQYRRASHAFSRVGSRTMRRFSTMGSSAEKLEEGAGARDAACATPEPMSPLRMRAGDSGPLLPISEVRSAAGASTDGLDTNTVMSEASTALAPDAALTPKGRFSNAVRTVMMLRSAASPPLGMGLGTRNPRRQRTSSSDGQGKSVPAQPLNMLRSSRVAALVPKLKSLETTQDLAAHQALLLATSSWDRTSVIFRVGDPFTTHRILAQPQGFVGQVAWSPNGSILLTKLNRGVKVWTEDGVCKKTIDRRRNVQSIAWLPGGEGTSTTMQTDVVIDTSHFDRMTVHDVAVTQDCQRMLCVGTLMASGDGLHPSKSRAEKQIIVYNLDKKDIENRVPVLHDVRDITLSRDDQVALVSYENKAPPQLWKLDAVKDTIRLSLRHTYMPKVAVDFAGPSYFGGKNDQLVLCAGKAGDIHIWDRESAALLHNVRAQAMGGDLTCIAWNHAVDPFMFATGSHDGAVRIWTTATDRTSANDAPSANAATTPNANTPRTGSPSLYDTDYLADSPQAHEGGEQSNSPHPDPLTDANDI
ncbi:WD40 repeat-like protein [Amylocystis lapponica]|nr:WD40 repeat-like protein [Amylocystis lapponica]